ncbi:MAG: hypothetical protein JWQ58_2918 [Reyranella sp.]|nr:hypothetical protein [Reyranella sp.]
MRKSVVAIGAVIALIGIGAAAIPFAEDYAATRLKAGLAQGGVKVETVKVGLLDRSITLRNVAGGPNGELKIDEWEASGLAWPLDELLKGRAPIGGLAWGDPLQVARFHMRNFRLAEADAGDAWTIGELTATNLDLPRYDAVYEGPFRNEVMVARLLGVLSVDRLDQSDLVHVGFDQTTHAVARLSVSGYARGLIDAFEMKGFQVKPAGARMAGLMVADTTARGIDLRRPIGLASSIDWEPGAPIGRVPVAEGRMSGFGGDLMTRYGMSLGSVSLATVREGAEMSRSRMRIEDFVLAPSLRSVEALGMRMVLQSMNLKEVRLGFDCSSIEDRARHVVKVEECKLSGTDLAEISFTAQVIETDDEFWRALDEADLFALLGTKAALQSAKLVIADKSLLQRSLQAKARLSGQPAAAERAALAAEIRRYQPPGVLITQDMSKLLDSVARFVEQGGTLTLEAAPQPALGLEKLDYLLKPGADLVNALGLTATVSR